MVEERREGDRMGWNNEMVWKVICFDEYPTLWHLWLLLNVYANKKSCHQFVFANRKENLCQEIAPAGHKIELLSIIGEQ